MALGILNLGTRRAQLDKPVALLLEKELWLPIECRIGRGGGDGAELVWM